MVALLLAGGSRHAPKEELACGSRVRWLMDVSVRLWGCMGAERGVRGVACLGGGGGAQAQCGDGDRAVAPAPR